MFCLAKHRVLSLDYFVLTNKERTARVTSPGGFAARQFLVMSHTDDEFPFRQYNYHDQLVARPDNYHDYCPELLCKYQCWLADSFSYVLIRSVHWGNFSYIAARLVSDSFYGRATFRSCIFCMEVSVCTLISQTLVGRHVCRFPPCWCHLMDSCLPLLPLCCRVP